MSNLLRADFVAPSAHKSEFKPTPDLVNTFHVAAVRRAPALEPGMTLPVNLATYLDPMLESDFHVMAAARPRWQQAANLTVAEVCASSEAEPRAAYWANGGAGFMPADKLVRGTLRLRGEDVPAHGVVHPVYPGWLKLALEDVEMYTIADLKRHIGKITVQKAKAQNEHHASANTGYNFLLPVAATDPNPPFEPIVVEKEFS